MRKKRISIKHPVPVRLPYCILPVGMFCNAELQRADIGVEVEFQTDWQKDRRMLVRKCRIPVNSSVFSFMMKSVYGDYMTIKGIFSQWEAQCVLSGYGKDGFSREECMLIEIKPLEKHEM